MLINPSRSNLYNLEIYTIGEYEEKEKEQKKNKKGQANSKISFTKYTNLFKANPTSCPPGCEFYHQNYIFLPYIRTIFMCIIESYLIIKFKYCYVIWKYP